MNSAGIYIHIPFCQYICNYCDYFTTEKREREIPHFVEMLLQEIELTASEYNHNWQFDSIYLGGGSPALLLPKDLEIILNKLRGHFPFSQFPEITLEINPGENSFADLKLFKEMEINRLSIGFQSLNPKFLNILTRTHNPDDCVTIYENARKAEFENISIDLLYNIPRQSVQGWLKDLKTIVKMQPEHIATYSLTAEKGTPFYTDIQNNLLSFPDPKIQSEMFGQGSEFLRENGFTQYEVSHFAKNRREAVHNLHYWKRDPYLAFGPSAHGFDGEKRYWNVASLDKYIEFLSQNILPIQNSEFLTEKNKLNEIIMNGLRSNLGVPTSCFDNIDSISIQKWECYLERKNASLFLKPEYFHLADEIVADLIVEEKSTTD